MFAQFVGLPGSGKTTLVSHLSEQYPKQFARVQPPQERLRQALTRAPLTTLRDTLRWAPTALHAVTDYRSPLVARERLAPVSTLIPLSNAYRSAALSARPWQLFEEFYLQRAVAIFGFSEMVTDSAVLQHFLRQAQRFPALPIFLEVSVDTALVRAEARSESLPRRLATLNLSERRLVLERQARLISYVKERQPEHLSVDGEQSVETCVEQLRASLTERAGEGP